jgi:hypothetical protein
VSQNGRESLSFVRRDGLGDREKRERVIADIGVVGVVDSVGEFSR